MTGLELFLIALSLSLDALAVSIAGGLAVREGRSRAALKVALYFGVFQALMPVLGWLAGAGLKGLIEDVDHWAAFGLLAFVGLRMIRESFRELKEKSFALDAGTLLVLAVATSLDALAVGLSFALLQVRLLPTVLVIGGVTCLVCFAGFLGGGRLGARFGPRVEAAGGLILIGIGLKILLSHLAVQ
ncbi:MAG: manganese efflux pump [Elusimicrobia bacterium]|nr:manganese efflux pump [Elusimicrobiota bacterium]